MTPFKDEERQRLSTSKGPRKRTNLLNSVIIGWDKDLLLISQNIFQTSDDTVHSGICIPKL